MNNTNAKAFTTERNRESYLRMLELGEAQQQRYDQLLATSRRGKLMYVCLFSITLFLLMLFDFSNKIATIQTGILGIPLAILLMLISIGIFHYYISSIRTPLIHERRVLAGVLSQLHGDLSRTLSDDQWTPAEQDMIRMRLSRLTFIVEETVSETTSIEKISSDPIERILKTKNPKSSETWQQTPSITNPKHT